jgi:FkbH-like protein
VTVDPLTGADAALERATWQETLFAERPQRSQLNRLRAGWATRSIRIGLHRNQSFELVASAMRPYLEFAGIDAEFIYSDYDDSLSFEEWPGIDVHIVWLDFDRYLERLTPQQLSDWLAERLSVLRERTVAPILVGGWPHSGSFEALLAAAVSRFAGMYLCDLAAFHRELGSAFFDDRRAQLTGSRLSDVSNLQVGRAMGSQWIPAVVGASLKAIVVDLDNTLYRGVLGEDGPEGLVLEDQHKNLQRSLLRWRDSGVFLAALSRNEIRDAEQMFAAREDFILRWSDFSTHSVSWNAKSLGLEKICSELRISPEHTLVIDDNPGELAEITGTYPSAKTLFAADSNFQVVRALDYFPGLWRWNRSDADLVRLADLSANQERAREMSLHASQEDYLRSLGVRIKFDIDDESLSGRISELSYKTNQFNVNFSRLSVAEVERRVQAPDSVVIAVTMSDRLSDSGLIAFLAGHKEQQILVLDEVCISCRALGRGLEAWFLEQAAHLMRDRLAAETIKVIYRVGPRNLPALTWLAEESGVSVDPNSGEIDMPDNFAAAWLAGADIESEVVG